MNVIMLINDTWRWDYLGCYGNDWIKTPNLDQFASEATLFEYCYSEGLPTVPTRTTFFTGRFTFPFRGWQRLEPTDVLLAEILWNKGFNTAMVTDVYHLHKPSMAFERGFDFTKHIRGHEGDPYIIDPDHRITPPADILHESSWDKPTGQNLDDRFYSTTSFNEYYTAWPFRVCSCYTCDRCGWFHIPGLVGF